MSQDTAQTGLTQHPLSAAFPGMAPLDFAELTNDIRSNGVQQPITIFEDMVLDGWHRYRAAYASGQDCPCLPFTGADPRRFVLSLNLNRRHLTGSQKAEAVVSVNSWQPSGPPRKGEPGSPLSTVKEMAEEAGVSERTIQKAKKAHAAGLGDAVKAGKVSVKKAAEIADLPEEEREAAIEAPAPKKDKAPKSDPTPERVTELETLLKDREEECRELISESRQNNDEFQAMVRIVDAEDQMAQLRKELAQAMELNRILQERLNSKMSECHGLAKDAKRWMNKFLNLERKFKALDRDTTFEKGA